ncbi:MAG: sugar O-acetyltransferase [Treponema sp.]|nr:sugar O-acetyltransferase [Treponema sp.]
MESGSEDLRFSAYLSEEALKITMELNNTYHTTQEVQKLVAKLTGKPINKYLKLFPPFYTDCGKNITIGKRVFINACCKFQDQGGITIGDDVQIGHGVILCTLNHDLNPDTRGTLHPAPIHIGNKVWIGSGAIINPGVTIGDGAIIASGAVVTSDIPANVMAAGVPARVKKSLI